MSDFASWTSPTFQRVAKSFVPIFSGEVRLWRSRIGEVNDTQLFEKSVQKGPETDHFVKKGINDNVHVQFVVDKPNWTIF